MAANLEENIEMIRRALEWMWNIQGLTCREAARLAASAMDRQLTMRERGKLLMHRLLCSYCRNYSRQLRLLRKWTRRMADPGGATGGAEMPAASALRIKKRLSRESRRPNEPLGAASDRENATNE